MKKLILLSTFFISISVYALPNCPSDPTARWHNCFGTYAVDGDVYVGEWKDNLLHGQGTYTYADGDKYVGAFKNDKINGQGTYTYANGHKYVGEYKDGIRNGQGTFTYANGDQYVGAYKNDKINGRGTYTFANGEKWNGYFMNGEYIPRICEDMGFVKGTESFGDCILELIEDL